MNKYDIVFLYGFNRKHGYYLNLVKALVKNYKVGIFVDPVKTKSQRKQKGTDQSYLNELISHGAELVVSPCECCILFAAIYHYSPECFKKVRLMVSFEQVVGYARFSLIPEHLEVLRQQLPIQLIFAEDIRLLQICLKNRGKEALLSEVKVKPIQFVYTNCSVFSENFYLDYLIIFPTHLGFKRDPMDSADISQKIMFMRNINQLLAQIPRESRVAYKLHSLRDGGAAFVHIKLEKILNMLSSFLLRMFYRIISNTYLDKVFLCKEIVLVLEYIFMKRRCVNFSDTTPYHNFPVELFYSNIRKGIITGRSNAVWGALKARIPVYNCDDNSGKEQYGNFSHLRQNYDYFGVPSCCGKLSFDEKNFDKVKQDDSIDLIEYLTEKLEKDKCVRGGKTEYD